MLRIMCEARELQIDHAQHDLRRRDGVAKCQRPARCDGRHRCRRVAVGRAPFRDDAGCILEYLFAGHALASPASPRVTGLAVAVRSTTAPMIDAGSELPSLPMLAASSRGSTPC